MRGNTAVNHSLSTRNPEITDLLKKDCKVLAFRNTHQKDGDCNLTIQHGKSGQAVLQSLLREQELTDSVAYWASVHEMPIHVIDYVDAVLRENKKLVIVIEAVNSGFLLEVHCPRVVTHEQVSELLIEKFSTGTIGIASRW